MHDLPVQSKLVQNDEKKKVMTKMAPRKDAYPPAAKSIALQARDGVKSDRYAPMSMIISKTGTTSTARLRFHTTNKRYTCTPCQPLIPIRAPVKYLTMNASPMRVWVT